MNTNVYLKNGSIKRFCCLYEKNAAVKAFCKVKTQGKDKENENYWQQLLVIQIAK